MEHADAAVLLQIRVQHGSGIDCALLFTLGDGQHAHASLREYDIAMPVWIGHASLIPEQGREAGGDMKEVDGFFGAPPGVFLTARVVIRYNPRIHPRGVDHVAEVVLERSIAGAV